MAKHTKNFIVLVDSHKKPFRATQGRYRVGAKTKKEAMTLTQKAIGFGSVHVYYEADTVTVPHGKVMREVYDTRTQKVILKPAVHATAPNK